MTFSNFTSANKVLSIGECMAELAPVGGENTYRLGFAGDTLNTAWYLAQISNRVEAAYFTAVGDDDLSREMRSFFRSSGIDDAHVQVVSNKTVGIYRIEVENGERSFTYWRGESAARHLAQHRQALLDAVCETDVVYLSGITLAILDHGSRETLMSALHFARKAGKVIVFDPNIRPRLWRSEQEMTGAIAATARVADILLPSFADEARWFGDRNPNETIDRYAGLGVAHVIVKDGENPVFLQFMGERQEVPFSPVGMPVDTTAAGDSFNAGVLAGLLDGNGISETVRHACSLAKSVIRQSGALVPVKQVNP